MPMASRDVFTPETSAVVSARALPWRSKGPALAPLLGGAETRALRVPVLSGSAGGACNIGGAADHGLQQRPRSSLLTESGPGPSSALAPHHLALPGHARALRATSGPARLRGHTAGVATTRYHRYRVSLLDVRRAIGRVPLTALRRRWARNSPGYSINVGCHCSRPPRSRNPVCFNKIRRIVP